MTSQNLFSLAGKTALITRGSRGLGLQIAEALGDHGARLIISSRKSGDLESARDHLKARGIEVGFIAADNARDEDIQRLADRSIAGLGRVDILVNNAGATWAAPTEDHPTEAWDKLMNLNVRAIFLLSQKIGKGSMIPNKYGRILNVASIAVDEAELNRRQRVEGLEANLRVRDVSLGVSFASCLAGYRPAAVGRSTTNTRS
jgi:NAD(P)-dependent dehydrogenase (short-subunit alcohol dehydrogenase family)